MQKLSTGGLAAAFAGLLTLGGISEAQAQQPITQLQPAANPSGWTFNVAPYLWMPTMDVNMSFNLPSSLSGKVSSTSSIGFGDLLSHLNFATMIAGEARYDRFSVFTDLIYLNVGGTASQFRTISSPGLLPIPITRTVNTSQSMNLNSTVWTLAGDYTVAQGNWGNVDLFAGFRYLEVNTRVNYSLGLTLIGPGGSGGTFGGVGGVSASASIWNGIGGVRGSIRIGDTGFFIPYYADVGTGDSNVTWQVSSGLGYHTRWTDLSLTYRYLTWEQSESSHVRRLSINGPLIMANFRF